MRTRYKNKRDYYKAEMERAQHEAEILRSEIEACRKKQEPSKKPEEKIEVKWFCQQCRVGGRGSVSAGTNIEDCTCPSCGARRLLAAAKLGPLDF